MKKLLQRIVETTILTVGLHFLTPFAAADVLANQQVTATGYECKLQFKKGNVIGAGNCEIGDRIKLVNLSRGYIIWDYCDLSSLKTLGSTTMCLFAGKLKKRESVEKDK